jgi:hypothetical protein
MTIGSSEKISNRWEPNVGLYYKLWTVDHIIWESSRFENEKLCLLVTNPGSLLA